MAWFRRALLLAAFLSSVSVGAAATVRAEPLQGVYAIDVATAARSRLPVDDEAVALSADGLRALVAVPTSVSDQVELRATDLRSGSERRLGTVASKWSDLAWNGRSTVAVTAGDVSQCTSPATQCFTYSTTYLPDRGSPARGVAATRFAAGGGVSSEIVSWTADVWGGAATVTGPAAAALAKVVGDPLNYVGPLPKWTNLPVALSFRGDAAAFFGTETDYNGILFTTTLYVVRAGMRPIALRAAGGANEDEPFLDRIAFARGGGRVAYIPGDQRSLCVLTLATRRSHCFVAGEGLRAPVWAPDGSSIAFVARAAGRTTVRIVRAGDGRERVVLESPLEAAALAWRGSKTLIVALEPPRPRPRG